MSKVKINLNSKDIDLLNRILSSKSSKSKAKLKAKVILMRHQDKSITDIMKETKLSKRTIINYTNKYMECKSIGLYCHRVDDYRKSELYNFKNKIKEEFNVRPPLTYKEAVARVEIITGIRRSETQIRNFLNKNDIYTSHTREHILYITRYKIECKTKAYKKLLATKKDQSFND